MYSACSTDALGFPVPLNNESAKLISASGFRGVAYKEFVRDSSLMPLEEMRELLERNNLEPSTFKLNVEFESTDEKYRSDLEKFIPAIDYAAGLGMTRCFSFVRPFSNDLTYLENFRMHCDRLRPIASMLADRGIILAIEFVGPPSLRTHAKYAFVHTLEETLELCDAIGTGNCNVLLDSYHWDLAGQTAKDFEKITVHQIGLVHVNDAPAGVTPELQEDMVRCLPGETGVLKIGEFVENIKKKGYTGPVVVEPFSARLMSMEFPDALLETAASLRMIGIPLR